MSKKFSLSLWGAAVAATLVVAGSVRADDIPWSYNGKDTTISVGASTFWFEGQSDGANGSSGVAIWKIHTTSMPTKGSNEVDHFSNVVDLTVNLNDVNSQGNPTSNQDVTFKGLLTADVANGSIKNFSIKWLPNGPNPAGTGSAILGDDSSGWRQYDAAISPISGVAQPGPNSVGAVSADVTITPTDGPGGPPTNESPEPASLALAGFGLSILGLAAARRRKLAKTAEANS
jgi:hypothetical protein